MGGAWVEPHVAGDEGRRFGFVAAGMLAFIGSETVFFGALIAADIHVRVHSHQPGLGLGVVFPAVNTVVLVLSGVAAHYAQVGYRRGRRGTFFSYLVVTLVLGTAFLLGQVWEYRHLGLGLSESLGASMFYVLTGFHGLHVLCGILLLLYLLVRATRERHSAPGAFTGGTAGMVDAGTYYWHFVDAVWVAVFVVVYLL
jgi:cytochrome c oxidase subunit 3